MKASGFTLIELVVVVAILGIIAMFSYPGLVEHVSKARRVEAQSVLVEAAQWLERYYSEHHQYHQGLADQLAVVLPQALRSSPRSAGASANYEVRIEQVSATTFTLIAVPTARMMRDRCGTLVLNQFGQKSHRGAQGERCWIHG